MTSSAAISKIHVASSTRMSLNDRFTAIAKPEPIVERPRPRSRSRSQNSAKSLAPVNPAASFANRRLLQQLARRHKIQAALKLKRRSMRTAGSGIAVQRGSIKALRVSNNGRPIKTNSLTKVATSMKADYISMAARRPLPRRSGSISRRLGANRPVGVGGAAERIAKRRLLRSGGRAEHLAHVAVGPQRRARSRTRSRARVSNADVIAAAAVNNRMRRGRSLSRGRVAGSAAVVRNGRSRSRSRGRVAAVAAGGRAVPIKARLGLRSGGRGGTVQGNGRGRRGGRKRTLSLSRRGVSQGRVQKPQVSGGGRQMNVQRAGGDRSGRPRGRSAVRNATVRSRSRSRSRKGTAGGQLSQQQQQKLRTVERRGRRGRSQTRSARGTGAPHKNGKTVSSNGVQQMQNGRSRSRGGRGGRGRGRGGARGGRQQGRSEAKPVNKDLLDKELDQYMATSSLTDMDYLLN